MEDTFQISCENLYCGDEIAAAAFDVFGIKYIYPWQRLAIENIIDAVRYGQAEESVCENDESDYPHGNQIILLPTGAGKSLCFQLPSLFFDGATVVIYPLLALMSDQERRIKDAGIECAVLRGGQTEKERSDIFQKIENGAKIIITNPETFTEPHVLAVLKKCRILHIAIDEAHCVSEWGDSFRPAYRELGKAVKELAAPSVTAFTATASPEVLARISEILFDGAAHIVRSESDRPNIRYYVKKVFAKKQAVLQLAASERRPMIIFCGRRSTAEETARDINLCFGSGTAHFYHAGLERAEKDETERRFFNAADGILCATCAYGMGIDKKDIRTVIHLDVPATVESYIQEAGRGGRDGNTAKAILLWNRNDSLHFSQFDKNSRYFAMRIFAETTECRRQTLLDSLGAEKAVCTGCDLCDSRRGIGTSAESLTVDYTVLQKLVERKNKFYTKETLESDSVKLLNAESRRILGLNIWNHEAFESVFNQLVSDSKLKIAKALWKGRICTV